jgi:hypothetical protein
MDNELYCYETYRGFQIYVESYLYEYDNGSTAQQFSGEIYNDAEFVDCGKLVAITGEDCVSICRDEIDWMLDK